MKVRQFDAHAAGWSTQTTFGEHVCDLGSTPSLLARSGCAPRQTGIAGRMFRPTGRAPTQAGIDPVARSAENCDD